MRYELHGSGPAVLFLHGIPTCGRLWDYVVPALQHQFTCVVVDLPGMGESPPLPDGSLDPARYAQELERLRERLSIPSWHVVGHDAGSTIAVHYAAQFSERLDRLVLCSPPTFPEFRVPWFFRLIRTPLLGDCLAPLVTLLLWRIGLPSTIEPHGSSTAAMIRAFHHPFRGCRGVRRFVRLLRWGDPARVLAGTAALLPQIVAPTLVLHGKKDRSIPTSFAIRAAAIIPDAELHLIDCRHFLPLNRPERVCEYLVAFLQMGDPDPNPG